MAITPYVPPSFLSTLPPPIWSGVDGLPVFPFLPGQAVGVKKGELWSEGVIRTASGRTRKTAYWPFPLWQFEVGYDVAAVKSARITNPGTGAVNSELAILWEFFGVAKGQHGTWLFVDPSDCQIPTSALLNPALGLPLLNPVTGQPETNPASPNPLSIQFGVGDGVTTKFQLNRLINSFSEPVFGVFAPTILDNGLIAGTNTVANGAVTFSVAPTAGHVLSWFGYFYYGCEFTQDDLTFDQIVTLLWSGKGLKFQSVRV